MVNRQYDTVVDRPHLDSFGVVEPSGKYAVANYIGLIRYSGDPTYEGNLKWRYEPTSIIISKGLTKW